MSQLVVDVARRVCDRVHAWDARCNPAPLLLLLRLFRARCPRIRRRLPMVVWIGLGHKLVSACSSVTVWRRTARGD